MLDIVYVLATVAFFAAMVLYVAACNRLGGGAGAAASREENTR